MDAAPAAAPKKGAPAASGASSGSGGKKAPADAAKAAAAAAAAAAAQQAPPPTPPPPADPAPLLDASLGAKLAPLVIHLHKVVNLPDAPATQEQLASSSCHPCSMSLAWGGAGATQQPASRLGAWQPAAGGAPGTREARFEAPWVVLLGEAPAGQLLRQLTEVPLVVEVHDRDAVPEQPLFPLPVEEGQAAQVSCRCCPSGCPCLLEGAAGEVSHACVIVVGRLVLGAAACHVPRTSPCVTAP